MRLAALLFALACCHSDPAPMHPAPGELPPLPPASGTPIGYLIDAKADLALRPDQLDKLQQIDTSLAARDAEIDTQLRQIEHPEEEEDPTPQQQKQGVKRKRHAYSPGSQQLSTNPDAQKLHALRDQNDRDAVKKALALLDVGQQDKAKTILADHDVEVPGGPKKPMGPNPSDGKPVPGLEP
jgi:hypothetical protein